MYIRKSRKGCIYFKGLENFDFDYSKELAIYKYMVGLPLTKEEYGKVCEHNRFNTYTTWKKRIYKHYDEMELFTLIEFRRHLIQRKRNKKTTNTVFTVMMSATTSCVLTYLFDCIKTMDTLQQSYGLWWIVCFLPLVVALIVLMLYFLIKPYWNENTERTFCTDYIEIIDEIISKKEKKKCIGG